MIQQRMRQNRERQTQRRASRSNSGSSSVPVWLRFWSAHGLNNKKSTIASAVYTIVFSLIIAGFSAYELYKVDRFWERYTSKQQEQKQSDTKYYNKDLTPLNSHKEVLFFLNISKTEKGLISGFLCVCIAYCAFAIVLIFAAIKSKKEYCIPWLTFTAIVVLYGTVLVILDCVVYSFGGENNLQLLIWVSFVFGAVHSLRCVVIFYRQLAGLITMRRSPTVTAGNRLSADSAIFSTPQSMEPVVIQMTPPPYEKDPPVYSLEPPDVSTVSAHTSTTSLNTVGDKPPDYTP